MKGGEGGREVRGTCHPFPHTNTHFLSKHTSHVTQLCVMLGQLGGSFLLLFLLLLLLGGLCGGEGGRLGRAGLGGHIL